MEIYPNRIKESYQSSPLPSPASSSGVSSGVDALKELAAEAPVAVFLLRARRIPLSLAA